MNPLEGQAWYRVCDLKPRLRDHVRVRRHRYRGQRWFVLEDRATGRTHRLDESAFRLVALMNGDRSVQRIWMMIDEYQGMEAPTQDETVQLLGQLHGADIVQCDVPPDTAELFERYNQDKHNRLMKALRSPFYVRLPLFDPDRWLERWTPRLAWLFTRTAALTWLLAIVAALVGALMHREELVAAAGTSLLTPSNLFLLWLVYPAVKAVHELGHALAVKHWGGEVHDVGLMLLVFMPVPYVDASTANAFEEKWSRVVVSGAGIAVELALAALALLVWLNVEAGMLSTLALNVMTIGGVSTLLFNGNPLLRFDGYYVLADAVEIPNLGTRANQYWGYLLQRYVLGATKTPSPVRAAGERRWFIVYGLAAFVYRAFILAVILLFVASVSLTAGVVLGAWAITGQILIPSLQRLQRLSRNPQLREQRARVIGVSLGIVVVAAGLLVVPMPYRTVSDGVVWPSDDAQIRTGTDCFVERLLSEPGSWVTAGTPLLECSEPFLAHRLQAVEAHLAELRARYTAELSTDRARARLIADQVAVIETQLSQARERTGQLIVRSVGDGRFIVPRAADLPGRFLEQGELVAYVVDPGKMNIRTAVAQADIGLVRARTNDVTVRLAERPDKAYAASLERAPPGATMALPSAALGTQGGGALVADPADTSGRTTLEPVFVLELRLADASAAEFAGARAFVRFDHGVAPLAVQWYRGARQLLLRRLAV